MRTRVLLLVPLLSACVGDRHPAGSARPGDRLEEDEGEGEGEGPAEGEGEGPGEGEGEGPGEGEGEGPAEGEGEGPGEGEGEGPAEGEGEGPGEGEGEGEGPGEGEGEGPAEGEGEGPGEGEGEGPGEGEGEGEGPARAPCEACRADAECGAGAACVRALDLDASRCLPECGAGCAEGAACVEVGAWRVCVPDGDGDGSAPEACGGRDCEDGDPAFGPEAAERCTGHDEDCDGAVDEGFPVGEECVVGQGGCQEVGQWDCHPSGLLTECDAMPGDPRPERCNRLDDDCDGAADEDWPELGDPCHVGEGACRRAGDLVCAADGAGPVCDGVPGDPEGPEVCNLVDDDCDGLTDEDLVLDEPCVVGIGECEREGVPVCADYGEVVCSGDPGDPTPEICDGLDNDCDGAADEGEDGPLVLPCYDGEDGTEGVGPCRGGELVCLNGVALDCEGQVVPAEEVCDEGEAVDNDCDGEVDEGLECGPPPCAEVGLDHCTVTPADGATEGCDAGHFAARAARGRAVIDVDLAECRELTVTFEVCDPHDWVLNIGDSPSNNGGGGDGGDRSNDAELQLVGTSLALIGNDFTVGDRVILSAPDFVAAQGCTTRTITVRDGVVETDVAGVGVESPYALRLNNEEREGVPDAVFYVGLNRVIANEGRIGTGLVRATARVR